MSDTASKSPANYSSTPRLPCGRCGVTRGDQQSEVRTRALAGNHGNGPAPCEHVGR
jgi:hypothetical protein